MTAGYDLLHILLFLAISTVTLFILVKKLMRMKPHLIHFFASLSFLRNRFKVNFPHHQGFNPASLPEDGHCNRRVQTEFAASPPCLAGRGRSVKQTWPAVMNRSTSFKDSSLRQVQRHLGLQDLCCWGQNPGLVQKYPSVNPPRRLINSTRKWSLCVKRQNCRIL